MKWHLLFLPFSNQILIDQNIVKIHCSMVSLPFSLHYCWPSYWSDLAASLSPGHSNCLQIIRVIHFTRTVITFPSFALQNSLFKNIFCACSKYSCVLLHVTISAELPTGGGRRGGSAARGEFNHSIDSLTLHLWLP